MSHALKVWMGRATPAQKRELAKLARTSVENLYHMANGRRGASSSMAIRLERASLTFVELPMLKREHLAGGCSECEFARRCRR